MKIIDAHTHIDYITHNYQSSVKGTVCCACKESDWGKIVDLVKSDDCVRGAFGVHPWFIMDVKNDFDKRLGQLLETDSNYMVGEIGLDKYKPDMEKQIDVFIKQFDIAIKLKRSIFLHCVGAWDKILHILKQYKRQELPIIVAHDFNGNDDILTKLLQYKNVMFSFGKNCLYGGFCRIDDIDINKILVETDGKRDILLSNVVEKIAKIKNESVSDMVNIINNNMQKVLDNGQIT